MSNTKKIKKEFRLSRFVYKNKQSIVAIQFLFIPLLLLLVFTYLPLAKMVEFSFFRWDGYSSQKEWIGLKNYVNIFSNPEYFQVFRVTIYYIIASVVQIALALAFATILSFKVRCRSLFKGILFFPYLINGVAIGFIFLYFFKPAGTLDSILTMLGLEEHIELWLGNPDIINISLAGVAVWRNMGLNLIMFIGAIQSISADLYEASGLDGANLWQQFRYIIVPNIKTIISLNIILSIKGAFSVFEIPYIMTGGGNGSMTFVIQTINTAFQHNKVGLASAMAVVLLMIVFGITMIQDHFFKGKEV